MGRAMAEVRLRGLGFRYPRADTDTLAGLDLDIPRGEAHSLLGGSGAGKTTLLNLLSGLLAPSAGEVRFDGRDVSRVRPRDRGVAQVFQFPVLYESLAVADLLALPLRNRGWRRADAARRVTEIAERLEIEGLLARRAGSLSLFHKQLVGIARAVVRPDVALVLLDEPLTAVQPSTKWRLRRALRNLHRELGATMIYVTHDQTEALTFADRVSVMHEGRILQTGTPETLYRQPVHEHVAHFIGSPGMNLLSGEARDGRLWLGGEALTTTAVAPGPCTIGFRPEWATVEPDTGVGSGVRGRVQSVRVLGIEAQRPVGIVGAVVAEQTLATRQIIDVTPGQPVRLRVGPEAVRVFRNAVAVDAGA
jgi:glycerol transport system ATP-binding protein